VVQAIVSLTRRGRTLKAVQTPRLPKHPVIENLVEAIHADRNCPVRPVLG
jgi:hypothetical protein